MTITSIRIEKTSKKTGCIMCPSTYNKTTTKAMMNASTIVNQLNLLNVLNRNPDTLFPANTRKGKNTINKIDFIFASLHKGV
jgi:hypothetical protein